MKRGKEDEKIMGPMFPRLHVNDTEKGGPRAPPRNKMALYEQLTIPSQRYNCGLTPPKQNNNSKLAPSTSTSQGTSHGQSTYFPLYQPPSALAYDDIQVRDAEASNSNNQLVRVESKKKPPEEDDFMVPIFSEAGTEMRDEHNHNSVNEEVHFYLSSNQRQRPTTTVTEETNHSKNGHLVSKQQIKDDERSMRVSVSSRSSLDVSMSAMDDTPWQNDASLPREHQGKERLRCSNNSGLRLLEVHRDSLPAVGATLDEEVPDMQRENFFKDTSLRHSLNPQTGGGFMGGIDINGRIPRIDDSQSLEKENIDRGDNASESSVVDSASEFDITPDNVVDIIGRKHFWKARTAIVNQQRVFAVQVFELHRLLKVQKLIAGSPNLLLEASAYVGKSSEYVVKALPRKGMQKDVTGRANDKVEGTAENAVPKAPTPVLSKQQPIQPVGYPSFSNNTELFPPGSMDPKMNTWGFHQPSAHQWLVPVMTPSEGLVYKPYPPPGFMGPVCGGCGPMGYPPGTQYQPGMGIPPGIHFGGPGYFPPYGMSMMSSGPSSSTVDHLNPLLGSNQYSQTGQPDTVTSPPATRSHPHGQGEQRGSTASSPSGRTQGMGTVFLPEGRDSNHLFAPPPTTEFPVDTPPREKQARVIRAVPRRSTSDSAARMFQSIQQERQLHES